MLKFTVDGQKLELLGDPFVVADSFDYLTGSFKFYSGHDWDLTEKHVFFQLGTGTPYEVTLTDDEFVKTDHVNLTTGAWDIHVVGYDIDGSTLVERITTDVIQLTVERSGISDGEPFPPSIIPDVLIVKDQTTPQTFVNGVPKLAADRVIENENDMVDAKHVADAVAAVTADDFNHNSLSSLQGGSSTERYHMTQAQNAALHTHSNKSALDLVSGTNTGDQVLPTRDSLGLDTDDNVTFANLSGTNTGDQDVSGAISTHDTGAGAHAGLIAPFRRPLNGMYDGVDLSTVFATAADFRAAVAAGDFSKIKVGDYWPITLSGTFRDYSSYTVPSGVTYYSDAELTISAGTTATTYEGLYASATAVSFKISSTTYYTAIGGCLAYFARMLSNAVLKLEVGGINPYYNHGDTALAFNHIILISRDCIPVALKMRTENSVWYNTSATNPWLGSALYETLNNSDYGLLKLIADSNIGAYIYAGPNSKGMRWLGEIKAAGVATPTSWSWFDRGKIFLPFEPEIWGQSVFADNYLCKGLTNQLDIFRGTSKHIVKGLGNGGSRSGWWCASAIVGASAYFDYVNYGGYPVSSGAVSAIGVPACFLLS